MKFARILEYHTIPEWSSYYVDYRLLKKIILAYKNTLSVGDSDISESLLGKHDASKELVLEIETQSSKVNLFYKEKLFNMQKEIDAILSYIYNLKRVSSLNEIETRSLLSMKERDDAQNRATSMQRAFTELYQHITWLEKFCEYNYIALLKILAKFPSDDLKSYLDNLEFIKWSESLNELKGTIYKTIAYECLNGDIELSRKMMTEAKKFKAKDLGIISFCIGMLLIMTSICFGLIFSNDLTRLGPSLCVFRMLFFCCASLLSFAFVIYVLESYSVNWIYIFELTPASKISYIHVLSSGITLLTLWLVLFTLHLSTTYYYPIWSSHIMPVISLGIFLALLFCPFNIFCRGARFVVLSLLFQLFIAPFGEIRFKNYMMGSWLTSMVVPIKDFYIAIVLIYSGAWQTNSESPVSELWLLLVSLLPFTWRILQNIKRVIYKKSLLARQVLNFIRYILSVGLMITAYFDLYYYKIWVLCFIISTSMIAILDISHDWQLNIDQVDKKRCFPQNFYYFAIVSNFILRFAGVASLMPAKVLENSYVSQEIALVICAGLEIVRRTQWSIIRIEREKCDNKESFREIQYIPVSYKY